MTDSAKSLTTGLSDGSGSLWSMTQHLRVTTFIGAGGKTTCLRSLTQEIESANQQVVATTTTKVYPEKSMIAWRNFCPPPQQKRACFWYDKVEDKSGKWIGPSLKKVDDAIAADLSSFEYQSENKRYWVIEGDGAREHKLKCWESYEPQIPTSTDCAVLVLDRGLWGNILQAEQVHRPHACKDLLGQIWNANTAWNYFLRSPVFAPQYSQMSWVILLNSAGKTIESNGVTDPINSLNLLHNLRYIWTDLRHSHILDTKPIHLRLAVGDAKEGDLQWFDLW